MTSENLSPEGTAITTMFDLEYQLLHFGFLHCGRIGYGKNDRHLQDVPRN